MNGTVVRSNSHQNILLELYSGRSYTRRIFCEARERNRNGLMVHQNASVSFRTKIIEEIIKLATVEPQLAASSIDTEATGVEIILPNLLRTKTWKNN